MPGKPGFFVNIFFFGETFLYHIRIFAKQTKNLELMHQLSVTYYSDNNNVQILMDVIKNFDFVTIIQPEKEKPNIKRHSQREKEIFLFNSKKFLSKHIDK